MTRKTITATALVAITLTASACNTVKGLGRDIQSVGEAGEEVISQAPTDDENVQDAR